MNQPISEVDKRTLTIERVFDAPRNLVWEAWTRAEHIANWWGPPGMKTTIKKHNFVVGGEWEYVMKMGNGQDFRAFGQYSRIEAPALLETSANFIPMTEGVIMQAEFSEEQEKTKFIFKVIHPTEEYARQQKDMGFYNGWGSAFDQLSKYLAEIQ